MTAKQAKKYFWQGLGTIDNEALKASKFCE
jgi:hypothetical protein